MTVLAGRAVTTVATAHPGTTAGGSRRTRGTVNPTGATGAVLTASTPTATGAATGVATITAGTLNTT